MGSLLREVAIEGFRGYIDRQTLSVAIPSVKEGSGLTILVGENNTGKSTVFEAIKKLSGDAKFLPKERSLEIPIVTFTDNVGGKTLITRGKKATVTITTQGLIRSNSFEIVPSRRHWQHNFHGRNTSNYFQYTSNSFSHDAKYSVDGQLGGLLEKIADNPSSKAAFNEIIKQLVPNFSDWEVDTEDSGQDVVKYTSFGGTSHDTSLVGDGIISLFRICAHLVSTNDDLILCIDEPELSLSPITQKNLARVLSKKATNKQIIISTHCPHFVRWEDILSGARVYRTRKLTSGACELRSLEPSSPSFNKIIAAFDDWQKPHVLDCVAKEIFFSDRVLYLEGQEDVGLVRRFMHQNGIIPNFEIFGYGAGGSANIQHFFGLSRELGIKAAAIFDHNGPGLNEAQAYSEFKVIEHKYDDIRTKPNKTGLFNTNGTISAANAAELTALLEDISFFFAA